MSDATDAWICWDAVSQSLLGGLYPDQEGANTAARAHWFDCCPGAPFIANSEDLALVGYEIMRHSEWLALRQIEAEAALSG